MSEHSADYDALIEAGWIDVATLREKVEAARRDVLVDLLAQVEDAPIRWQQGGGASTGWLVVRNIISERLRVGPREHRVVREHENFWWCSCSPDKARPVGYDTAHDALASVTASDKGGTPC